MKEKFYDIPGYEKLYQINKKGLVKSVERNAFSTNSLRKERMLKSKPNKKGYLMYYLYKKGVRKIIAAHQLVAITFLGHVRCGMRLVINHKNGDVTDNRLDNLEIVTNRQNCAGKRVSKTSKYTGVCLCKKTNKWRSNIRIEGKQTYLGTYLTEIEAYNAYINKIKTLTT